MIMDPKNKNGWPAKADPKKQLEKRAEMRPSQRLVQYHLNRSLRTNNLGVDLRSELIHGSFDLYTRLKPTDAIDSMYINSIVALHNATMDAFGDAAEGGKLQEERLSRAIEGTRTFIDLMGAFEARRAVKRRDDATRKDRLRAVLVYLAGKDEE
jgi:hypothetical protein